MEGVPVPTPIGAGPDGLGPGGLPLGTAGNGTAGPGRLLILAFGSRMQYFTGPGCSAVRDSIHRVLTDLEPDGLLTGGATGADTWAHQWGQVHLPFTHNRQMKANWAKYGKKAGRYRNSQMAVRVAKAAGSGWRVEVHGWWDGRSTGSAHMRDVARRRGLHVVMHDMSSHRR